MNAVISPICRYSNKTDVVYTTSPERAILSCFDTQYPPATMYEQEMGFGSLEEQTKVKGYGEYILIMSCIKFQKANLKLMKPCRN